ncbi:MAG TPA: hypothetical protein PKA20_15465 [Burkholderiaceae bacterium]|nr:hypothetical protein [Burkholderiaceae bacterium]
MSAASILEGHGFDRYRPVPQEPDETAEPGICVLCRETGPLEFRLIAARATDDTRATARTLLRRPAAGEQADFALIAPVPLAEERDAILALLAPHLPAPRPVEPQPGPRSQSDLRPQASAQPQPTSEGQASSSPQRPPRRRGTSRFPAGGSRRTGLSAARRNPPAV